MRNLFILFFFFGFTLTTYSQKEEKFDIVLKVNGDELIGKVTEIGEDAVKFIYKGESLSYSIKKVEILKIKFASGRIEFFNRPSEKPAASEGTSSNTAQGTGPLEHHNKVAIMPFVYLIDKRAADEEVRIKVQQECYTILRNHSGGLTIQDPMTTNALLIKAGITAENFRGYTPIEICDLLGVEYLVMGRVNQERGSVTNSQYNSSTTNRGTNNKTGNNFWNSNSSGSSTSRQSYQTSMNINVYTDKGENIFSQDHTAFFDTNDAYKLTLNYLLKRTPIYRK